MSSLSKMQIRGIRSFSPDRDETIEFYSPLTMIVGANGCGKTTIIESLKFSCTGSMPPNTKSGHLFVNDPAMTDATEVKAHIKLRFQNRSDQTCVSVRSLQVTKKRSKMEFKALEGVLRTTNNNGEKVSISLKCSDMDRVFPENLGVSPAILENVIFCHQEESNWPMMEGIVLKKKFDDVFESTRYTKALEAYGKAKKEFQGKAKDLKAELMEFGAHLLAANQAKDELKTCEETQEMCNEQLEKLAEKLERNEAQLRACKEILDSAKGSEAELQRVQLLISEAERRVFDKTRSLESKLDGSDEEIQTSIANFDLMVGERQRELERMQDVADNLQLEVAMIRSEMDQLSIAKGKAVVLQDASVKFREDQISLSRGLQRKYNLPLPATNWTPTAAKDYTQHIRKELTKTQTEAAEALTAGRRAVDAADKQHGDVRSAVEKLEVELKLKTDEAHSMMSEADHKRSEITKLSSSRNTIQQCQMDFDDAQKTLDEFMGTYNVKANDMKKGIKDATDQIRNLQDLISEDANTLQEMSLHRNEIANLETSLKQIEIESSQITLDLSGVVRVHREAMAEFSDVAKDCNDLNRLMPRVQERSKSLQKDHSTTREELSQLKSKLAANEALLEQEQKRAQTLYAKLDKLSSKERSINPCVDQLNELRRSRVFAESKLPEISYAEAKINDLVDIAKQTMDEAHELLIIAKSGQIFMKRFKKSRTKNNGDCPCCKQSMSAPIAEAYEQNMKTLFLIGSETSQCSVEDHTATFDACLAFHKDIQELQVTLQPLVDVREDIKVADSKVVELNQNSNVIRSEIQSLELTAKERDARCTSFGKIIQDLNDINVRWESVSKRKSELLDKRKRQSQTLMTQGDAGGRSMAEMEQEQRNRMEQNELQVKKDRLMNEDANLQKRLFSYKNMVSEREKALSDAKIEGNRYSELETALNSLQGKLSDFESRKAVLVAEKSVLSKQATDAAALLAKAKTDLHQTTELWDNNVNVIKADYEAFNKLVEGFEDNEKQYQDLNLAAVAQNFDRLQAQVAAKEEEGKQCNPKINALTAELQSQEHIKRNMHANLELRKYEAELRGLKQQLSNLEKTTSSTANKLKTTEKELQAFTKESQSLASERDTIRGKLAVHNQQVAELKSKLNNATYKGIDEKHRRKNIQFETTNLAVQDLESYSTALDKALQNFHTLKIKEINRIIRELWQLIYKGQDIDMIELESGQDEGAASTKGSKSYNYRVVMRKGDVPLDMRGRCSAGQKVLAAIVIRLALAETFCLNCGMLALDEPTTNLDEPNKLGLAHALSRIIVGRQKQHNFQLICITHDEEFVKMMSDELSVTADFNMPEYYFRIYRQEEGNTGKFFSHIERVPWEDM